MGLVAQQILESQEISSFRFTPSLLLTALNQRAQALIPKLTPPPQKKHLLTDLFPEFIGSEEVLSRVILGQESHFTISNVNRVLSDGKMIYIDLTVVPFGNNSDGYLLVKDVTTKAAAIRELNQLRYEKILSHHGILGKTTDPQQAILGESPAIQKVRQLISKLASVPQTTVLILGESGTGKNLAANILHYSSMPQDSPFIEINCAAIPENLLEAEMFGHEKGAFTGAVTSREGLFKAAEGGTLFLNEIGEMPISLQAKLLTVLETKSFRKLGSTKTVKVDTRVITATNQDLQAAVKEKRFRGDLYYRLNVVSIMLPPLREMGRDRLTVAQHLVEHYNKELQKKVTTISIAAQKKMMDYHWPGNVRELGNCIERAMIFCQKTIIEAEDLLIQPHDAFEKEGGVEKWDVPAEGLDLAQVERQLIESALQRAEGNKSKAAQLLGMSRDKLRYRMEKYSL